MAQVLTDCLYRGERDKAGTHVTVHLSPGEYHSLESDGPAAFDWGRPTPGAQGLAARILREALDQVPPAGLAEDFFLQVVCQLPFVEPWVLWRRDVRGWAENRAQA